MDAIVLNGFSFEILANGGVLEKVIYKNGNYYALPDGSIFGMRLGNGHSVRCDAHIWIDANKLGVWRINPYSRIVADLPANLVERYCGLRDNRGLNIDLGERKSGLITVEFRPEVCSTGELPVHLNSRHVGVDFTNFNYLCKNYSDTVTPAGKVHRTCTMNNDSYVRYTDFMLSPHNVQPEDKQGFVRVRPLERVDADNTTIIYARIVSDNDKSAYRRKYLAFRGTNQSDVISSMPLPLELQYPNRPHNCNKDSPYKLSGIHMFYRLGNNPYSYTRLAPARSRI